MGSSKIKTVDMSMPIEGDADTTKDSKSDDKADKKVVKKPVQKKIRSKRYVLARSKVDKTKTYELLKAIELVKKLSRPKHPTITADINYNEGKYSGEIQFPHSTGKSLKVAITTESVLKKVTDNKIDFDILLAKPEQMKDVAKLAKILGPKGLMPNPKNKTITPDPKARKKELEAGKTTIRTEKKAPIIHVQIGNTSMTKMSRKQ